MLSYLPPVISTYGADIDHVMSFVYALGGVWFLLAEALLVFMLIRFRKRDGVRAQWLPATTPRSMAWVLVPAFLVLMCDMAIEGVSGPVWAKVKEDAPNADVVVRVTGRQFAWSFTYAGPDGKLDTEDDFDADDMHVPVGKVVRMELESVDVLHSFWQPELRLKQDVIPGRSIPAWFEATVPGTYQIGCAELCGRSHTYMKANLVVDTPEAFDAWFAGAGR